MVPQVAPEANAGLSPHKPIKSECLKYATFLLQTSATFRFLGALRISVQSRSRPVVLAIISDNMGFETIQPTMKPRYANSYLILLQCQLLMSYLLKAIASCYVPSTRSMAMSPSLARRQVSVNAIQPCFSLLVYHPSIFPIFPCASAISSTFRACVDLFPPLIVAVRSPGNTSPTDACAHKPLGSRG